MINMKLLASTSSVELPRSSEERREEKDKIKKKEEEEEGAFTFLARSVDVRE